MKKCSKCKIQKPLTEYWNHPRGAKGLTPSCKSCHKNAAAVWRAKNPDKMAAKLERKKLSSRAEPREVKRDRQLKHKYGISLDTWKRMLERQSGNCGICARHYQNITNVLQVDHSHLTGKVRGLLCTKCNTKLAAIESKEFMYKALKYLKIWED